MNLQAEPFLPLLFITREVLCTFKITLLRSRRVKKKEVYGKIWTSRMRMNYLFIFVFSKIKIEVDDEDENERLSTKISIPWCSQYFSIFYHIQRLLFYIYVNRVRKKSQARELFARRRVSRIFVITSTNVLFSTRFSALL